MRSVTLAALLVLPLAAALSACGEDPFFAAPSIRADTVAIAVPGAEANLPSAVDLVDQFRLLSRPERVEDAERFDVALRRVEGGLALSPNPTGIAGRRGAGIAPTDQAFDAIEKAPRALSAFVQTPVEIEEGDVFLLRSRQFAGGFGACVKFAKAKVVALDEAAGTARLAVAVSDRCDDERLVAD